MKEVLHPRGQIRNGFECKVLILFLSIIDLDKQNLSV